MGLAGGTKLGQYEVRELIGAGGMGEVYRAHDSKLGRDVAIKVLPLQFARDPERLARFRREATLLASLNHSNIAQIYGVEDSGDTHYLVMEFVSGLTLAERVISGPVEIDEALDFASQICQALEHAHEKSVIHRDLKPANVKVTPEGKVKVLDFGLAKAFAGDSAASGTPTPEFNSNSPTLSAMPNASPTMPGVILGTAAYMSPEQARGKTVDKRTDIWALGCVMYELLTGKKTFPGENVTDILGAVLHKEPDWSSLPADIPPAIRALLRRCLQKDAQQRPRDAADIRLELDDARAAATSVIQREAAQAPAPRRLLLMAAIVCVAVATITGMVVWQMRPSTGTLQVSRSVIPLEPNVQLAGTGSEMIAVSPDGAYVAYVARGSGGTQQIYLRASNALGGRAIPGTEGANGPFFSPDGQWIGFFTIDLLKKVSVSGGATLTICNASNHRGAAWGPNNTIVFAPTPTTGLYQVPAGGGDPKPLSTLKEGEISHRWPQFLPDGNSVLYTAGTASGTYDDAQIAVMRLDTGEQKVLIRGGTYGRYVPTGHLVYYRTGTMLAVPFDSKRLEVIGMPTPALEGLMSSTGNTGVGQFSFSELGSLVYVPGAAQGPDERSMVWVDRRGVGQPLPAPPHPYGAPKLSPDGKRVLIDFSGNNWIYDIARDALTRVTFEGSTSNHNWTPDGKRIAYISNKAGAANLYWKLADGSGTEERLTTSPNQQYGGTFSPDGRTLVFPERNPKTGWDLMVLPLDTEQGAKGTSRDPHIFLQTRFNETNARLSPDGHWLAYVSDASGRLEVYVTPFPGPGGNFPISTEGGAEIAWSPKGNELFYRPDTDRQKMMVVDIQTQPTFSAGKPRLLFEGDYYANTVGGVGARYSVAPDGQRFLMLKADGEQAAALGKINLVQNWFEELKQKVPTGK